MTCDSVSKLIPLYFYGELEPDQEDQVEQHLHECSACGVLLESQQHISRALDQRVLEAPPELLRECRGDLMAAIQGGASYMKTAEQSKGPWRLFLDAITSTLGGFDRYRTPIGALALLALGFFTARLTMRPGEEKLASSAPLPSDQGFVNVRAVRPDAGGRVQIDWDETRRRSITGSPEDNRIQQLVLAAAHQENPAVRLGSVELLKDRAANRSDVRSELINMLLHDNNAGVRMKALEGLRPLNADTEVRKALLQVLLNDDNPALRVQAVDLITARNDDSMVGMWQDIVQREDNEYVRRKLAQMLKDKNASPGTF